MSIKFIDLFSGCGGLTEAFLNNKKFSPIKIIDNDKFCYDTTINRLKKLRFKNPEKIVELKDISNSKTINNFKDIKSDIVIGGPPCQAYSVAGRIRDKHGMKKDYRNYLFESFLKIINYSQPKYFVIYNFVYEDLNSIFRKLRYNFVVKDDGLKGGKGVKIYNKDNYLEAFNYCKDILGAKEEINIKNTKKLI